MEGSDGELVARVQGGDREAAGVLYLRYREAIYRYIFFRVKSAEDAHDLTGQVFLEMVEHLGTYEDRGWAFSTWLYKIASSRVIDYHRRRRNRFFIPIEERTDFADGPDAGAVSDRLLLHSVWSELTVEQREVLFLRFVADMKIDDVSRLLGRSSGTVKSQQYRGLQRLSQLMAA